MIYSHAVATEKLLPCRFILAVVKPHEKTSGVCLDEMSRSSVRISTLWWKWWASRLIFWPFAKLCLVLCSGSFKLCKALAMNKKGVCSDKSAVAMATNDEIQGRDDVPPPEGPDEHEYFFMIVQHMKTKSPCQGWPYSFDRVSSILQKVLCVSPKLIW